MKSISILAFVAIVCLAISTIECRGGRGSNRGPSNNRGPNRRGPNRRDSSSSSEERERLSPEQLFLNGVNRTVQALLDAQVSNEGTYVWDLLPLNVRIFLVTQTQVKNIWNVTVDVEAGLSNLTWSTLPGNVQALLSDQKANHVFLNLTLAEWGFVSVESRHANLTFLMLIKSECQNVLGDVYDLLDQIDFDTQVNTTLLESRLVKLRSLYATQDSLTRISRGFGRFGGRHRSNSNEVPRHFSSLLKRIFKNEERANLLRLLRSTENQSYSRCNLGRPLGAFLNGVEKCAAIPRRL